MLLLPFKHKHVHFLINACIQEPLGCFYFITEEPRDLDFGLKRLWRNYQRYATVILKQNMATVILENKRAGQSFDAHKFLGEAIQTERDPYLRVATIR